MKTEHNQQTPPKNQPGYEAATDIFCLPELLVNIFLVGRPGAGSGQWALVDTGVAGSAQRILEAVETRFGTGSQPTAIVLTHGHFDHVGSVIELADHWNVPVYAHSLEMPYITGQKDYPPGDPTVSSGLMAKLSPLYPHKAINIGHRAATLPADGSVPPMPGWRWIHTPGHTPGHISLFRDSDRVLIAGDAVTTVKQESASAVLTQKEEMHGPPAYFTTDWEAAWRSAKQLKDLNPSIIISSHGKPMRGEEMMQELRTLSENFDHLAIPDQGRFVEHPRSHP